MKLNRAQISIITSWIILCGALVLGQLYGYIGVVVGLAGVGLFRLPYVNDAKSMELFTKERPKIAYSFALFAGISAVWLFVESMRNDSSNPTITENIFVDHYMWLPLGAVLLLCVAHEAWLFPKLRGEQST